MREFTVTESSFPASDFWAVGSSSDVRVPWETEDVAGEGTGDGGRLPVSLVSCSSAFSCSLVLISTTAFLISPVGEPAVGEEEADATDGDADTAAAAVAAAAVAAAAAAAAARVILGNTGEPFSSTIVRGLLRRCRVPT